MVRLCSHSKQASEREFWVKGSRKRLEAAYFWALTPLPGHWELTSLPPGWAKCQRFT